MGKIILSCSGLLLLKKSYETEVTESGGLPGIPVRKPYSILRWEYSSESVKLSSLLLYPYQSIVIFTYLPQKIKWHGIKKSWVYCQ